MGNAESRQNSNSGQVPSRESATGEMRTCYYDVLEVERSSATSVEEIKKASTSWRLGAMAVSALLIGFEGRPIDG